MSRRCYICGRDQADILCKSCGRFVCDSCYDEEKNSCVNCAKSLYSYKEIVKAPVFLISGLILILVGVMVIAYSLVPEGESGFIFFPFIFTKVNPTTAFLLTLIFYGVFTLSSLLPIYMSLRRNQYWEWDEEIYQIQDTSIQRSKDTTEYIITTEIPRKLQDSIFLEDEVDRVVLMSKKDKKFIKIYNLPDGYTVDSVESDYEGSFLILKMQLRQD